MSAVVAPPASPFKGLAAFDDSELDALFFFGRERETEVVVANMLASRLTVLYGESGVGKSSLLRAAVVRELREQAPEANVALHDTWSGTFDIAVDLPGAVEAYLILDQFEEYFLYHGEDVGGGPLLRELPELLRESRTNVLISLREDSLARLDAFKARLPNVFANQVRLEHLDRAAARGAVLGPIGRWNELTGDGVEAEPSLVDAVLEEVAVEGRSHDLARIEAPYLQLVLERLWETERAAGSSVLRLATLRELGGAKAIVRDHLRRALAALASDEQDVAARMFEHLVTPSGTKIAHQAADLAEYADVPEASLRHVLAALTRDRIVHSVDGSDRYEIFHDVLADPIRDWRQQRRLERERSEAERRHRRTLRVAMAAGVALVLVTAVAVFALLEWSRAHSQARHADAVGLEESALVDLNVDPQRGLLRALDAARLAPNARAEDVLRQVLIASRVRLVLAAGGPVRAVAFSPDGRRILTASTDGLARLYDVGTGRVVATVRHAGRIEAVAFSPDGSLAVTADDTGVARVWETRHGRQLAVLRQRGAITNASFTGDGTGVLTAGADGQAHLWQAPTARPVRVFRSPGRISVARQSPDGRGLVTVAEDDRRDVRTRLFDVRSGRLLKVLPEHGVNDAEFSPDGRLFATGARDGAVRVHSSSSGKLVRVLDDGGGSVLGVAFSPDGRLLATAGADGGVRVWTVRNGTRLFFFPGHTDHVVALTWSPGGRLLADASLDRTSRIWQIEGIEAGLPAAVLIGHTDGVTSVAFSPDGHSVVTGSEDGTARVWDVRVTQDLELLGRDRAPVATAAFDPTGRRLVAASADGTARIWDARTHRLLGTLAAGAPLDAASFSPDGSLVVTAGADGTARLWDAASYHLVRTLGLGSPVVAAVFSPDGRLVAAGSRDGAAAVWRVGDGGRVVRVRHPGAVVTVRFDRDGRRLLIAREHGVTVLSMPEGGVLLDRGVPGGVVRAALSPDGKLVATAGAHRLARLYDVRSGKLVYTLRGHSAPLTDVIFSADGRRLATTSADGHPRIWDVRTGKLIFLLVGHFGPVATAAFSADGRWLVTAGPISAGLWPLHTGRLLFYLRGDTKRLTDVSFSPDGRQIASASADGTVRLYDCELCAPLKGLVALAQHRLARTAAALTRDQRERYLPH